MCGSAKPVVSVACPSMSVSPSRQPHHALATRQASKPVPSRAPCALSHPPSVS
ncbi:hypothetical protein B0I35DRAFT_435985 [Stachybotrys elegans]|uniref:Uncharacterized protein n=1 Tax=Stachybotrys elegans TaxID=80388 RepID=A0A8K0WPZ3_9HYPO|nr:hypothetical protein B0I35DRAFT_435985 [Stachybotrys elegans]